MEILLNKTTKIVIAESEWQGKSRIDIREFFLMEGAWLPSKRGVNFPKERWSEFVGAVIELDEAMG